MKVRFDGLNKSQIMRELEAHEEREVAGLRPIVQSVLQVTMGTQYFSTDALVRMGNPYRIGGSPPLAAGIINKQTGGFYSSLRTIGPTKLATLVAIRVFSEDEERAQYMDGTENQIPRPYAALARARLRSRVEKHFGNLSQFRIKVN